MSKKSSEPVKGHGERRVHEGFHSRLLHNARTLTVHLPPGYVRDPLRRYPVLYMHGRNQFSVSPENRRAVELYLERGGVLVADSCCGAKQFDKSFREFIAHMYPDRKLERIPITHEIFSDKNGRDIKLLKRRSADGGDGSVDSYAVRTAEPLLEGIELDGRYAVIYSKYDISCALERQNSGNCEGYLPEDAVILGSNIMLYAMLQNVRLKTETSDVSR